MENRPEYVGLWLGLSKVGIVPALINTNLQGQPLVHSIKAASATGLIFGAELENAVYGATDLLPNVNLYKSGISQNSLHLIAFSSICLGMLKPTDVSNTYNLPNKALLLG